MAGESSETAARLGWTQRRRVHRLRGEGQRQEIRVFTTRIDTIFGATAIVLSAEHPLLDELLEGSALKNRY